MPVKRASQNGKSDRVFGYRRNRRKMFQVGRMPVFPATISRPSQCRFVPCTSTPPSQAGLSLGRRKRSVPALTAATAEELLGAARRREIDAVLVWRLDRWGRSLPDLVTTLEELNHLGVGFVSLTETLDLTTPTGRAMAGLLSVFAAFERDVLRERVRAGLAEARRMGRAWDDRSLRDFKASRVVSYIAPASAKPKSLDV